MKKRYKWNKRKCAENMAMLALIVGTGLLIGYVFAMWAMAGGAA